MSPAKSSHCFYREYILQFDEKYNGKNICLNSSSIFRYSIYCAVDLHSAWVADAQSLLLCVTALQETACQLLSTSIVLQLELLRYICAINDYIYLLSTYLVVYLPHGVTLNHIYSKQ